MSGASRSGLVVAASIGTVEAMKDQLGVCIWNQALRSVNQRGVQSRLLPPPSCSGCSEKMKKIERREMSFLKVMHLSCFGPSTVRF